MKVRSCGLECMMNGVSDGDRSTSLSSLSCAALQSDEIIGILKVLFWYVGNGTAVGPHEHGLAEHSGGCHPDARPDRLCARASLVTVVLQDTPPQVIDCAVDSRLNFCHKTTFHNFSFYFLTQFGTGKPCVICQDKTRLVEFPLRAGIGARYVRAEGGRSLV